MQDNNNTSQAELTSAPLGNSKSTPLTLSAQVCCRSHHVSSNQIAKLAIEIYRKKYGSGITYEDLLDNGLAYHKRQSQDMLKYHLKIGTLFTLGSKRTQQYYPAAIRSEIIKNKQRNTPIDPTGVAYSNILPISNGVAPLANCLELLISQTLIGYVLPLLPITPSFIHNLHFKTRVSHECYEELNLPHYNRNYGKHHTEVIGNTHVNYIFYSSGTVDINTKCSNNPYRLETEEDRSRIIAFFGQIRDRLIVLLCDKHERIVPDIMEWQLTECDINKDVKVSDLFHFTAIKIQVRHIDHLFSVYIKSMGKDTVCRIEERKHTNDISAVEFINHIFNPYEEISKQLNEIRGIVARNRIG